MEARVTLLDDAQLDETFAALANSTRRALLTRLLEGETSVNDLAAPFDLSLPAISKHIKVLEQAGLVTRTKQAQFRLCSINPERIADVADWTEQYRHIWDDRFNQIDNYVRTISAISNTTDNPEARPEEG